MVPRQLLRFLGADNPGARKIIITDFLLVGNENIYFI
jgi:hypothetical protein